MRTNLEFRSIAFPACPGEEDEVNPGRYGKALADYLAEQLPGHGFAVSRMGPEDWGWRIDLRNEVFPLWIGCGNYEEYDDGFLCFIEPSKPFVRQWLKRVPTAETVERLATAVEHIVRASGKTRDVRWWTEAEASRS